MQGETDDRISRRCDWRGLDRGTPAAMSTMVRWFGCAIGSVFITTSRFSADARDYAERINARLILIDGPELATLMIKHGCGVVTEETYTLKQIDENFFPEA